MAKWDSEEKAFLNSSPYTYWQHCRQYHTPALCTAFTSASEISQTNITTTELYFPQEFSSNLICWYGNELPCLSQAGRKVEVVSGGIRSSVYEGVIFWWALLPVATVREILRETPINLGIDIETTFTSFLLFFVSHFYWNSRVVFRGTHLSWFQLG